MVPTVVYPAGQVLVEVDKHPAELAAWQVVGAQVKKEKKPQDKVHLASPKDE